MPRYDFELQTPDLYHPESILERSTVLVEIKCRQGHKHVGMALLDYGAQRRTGRPRIAGLGVKPDGHVGLVLELPRDPWPDECLDGLEVADAVAEKCTLE